MAMNFERACVQVGKRRLLKGNSCHVNTWQLSYSSGEDTLNLNTYSLSI